MKDFDWFDFWIGAAMFTWVLLWLLDKYEVI